VVTPGEAGAKKTDDAAKFRMLMLTPDVKAQLEGVSEKIAKPGFRAKIRVIYYAPMSVKNVGRVWSNVKGALTQFAALGMNSFRMYKNVLTKRDYVWEELWVNRRKRNLLGRYIGRSFDGAPSTILNTEELATIFHFPIITVKAPLVKKTESRRAEPPSALPVSYFTPGAENNEGPSHAGDGAWSKRVPQKKPGAPTPVVPPEPVGPPEAPPALPFV